MGEGDECESDGGAVSGDEVNYHLSCLRSDYHVEEVE